MFLCFNQKMLCPTQDSNSMRIQLIPNIMWDENRLCLMRLRINNYSNYATSKPMGRKMSISVCWRPKEFWIGCRTQREAKDSLFVFVSVLPCFPLRIHLQRSFGGCYG